MSKRTWKMNLKDNAEELKEIGDYCFASKLSSPNPSKYTHIIFLGPVGHPTEFPDSIDEEFPLDLYNLTISPLLNSKGATWKWNGSLIEPTFAPSILRKGVWHGWIKNGILEDN